MAIDTVAIFFAAGRIAPLRFQSDIRGPKVLWRISQE